MISTIVLLLLNAALTKDTGCLFNLIACVDNSASNSDDQFNRKIDLVYEYYIQSRNIVAENIDFTLIVHSSHLDYEIDHINDQDIILQKIMHIKKNRPSGGPTSTFKYLDHAKRATSTKPQSNIPNLMLVVADGEENDPDYIDINKRIKLVDKMVSEYNFFFQFAEYGIENKNKYAYIQLVKNDENYISDTTFNGLKQKINALTSRVCDEIQTCTAEPSFVHAANSETCKDKQKDEECPIFCDSTHVKVIGKNPVCQGRNLWIPNKPCVLNNCNDLLPKEIISDDCADKALHTNCTMRCKVDLTIGQERLDKSQCVLEKCTESICEFRRAWRNVPSCPALFEEKTRFAKYRVFIMIGVTSLIAIGSFIFLFAVELRKYRTNSSASKFPLEELGLSVEFDMNREIIIL